MFALMSAAIGGEGIGGEAVGGAADTALTGFSASDFYSGIVNVLLALAVIIGLIILLIRFLAAKTSRWSAKRRLHVHAGVQLGQHKSLQIVEIGDFVYIVGVGENITLIDRIDDPVKARELLESLSGQPSSASAGFAGAAALMRRLRIGRTDAAEGEELSAAEFRELLESKMKAAGANRDNAKLRLGEEDQ